MSCCVQEDPWIGWINYMFVFFKNKTFLPLQQKFILWLNPGQPTLCHFHLLFKITWLDMLVTVDFSMFTSIGDCQLFLWLILMYTFLFELKPFVNIPGFSLYLILIQIKPRMAF